jgi:hypothetical protein
LSLLKSWIPLRAASTIVKDKWSDFRVCLDF